MHLVGFWNTHPEPRNKVVGALSAERIKETAECGRELLWAPAPCAMEAGEDRESPSHTKPAEDMDGGIVQIWVKVFARHAGASAAQAWRVGKVRYKAFYLAAPGFMPPPAHSVHPTTAYFLNINDIIFIDKLYQSSVPALQQPPLDEADILSALTSLLQPGDMPSTIPHLSLAIHPTEFLQPERYFL